MIAPSRKISLLAACLWVAALKLSAQPAVVINEIMYHPSSEDVREEYVELYNTGPTNVSLSGWTLSGGVAFTVPAGTTLGAGNYLVVAAHLGAFNTKYPAVANVVGGWLSYTVTNVNGRSFTNWAPVLSNTRNTINLNDAGGQRIDSVTYADSGDWAIRRRGLVSGSHRGWTWYAEHDGLGKSLELLNPALPNEYGQDWASSTTVNGTPGRANSTATNNIAPMLIEVHHAPVIPRSADPVSITALVLNESAPGVTVTLQYRVDSASPPPYTAATMFDDGAHGDALAGDGIYGVVLPAMANNTLVDFYVEATDAQGNYRSWPGPTYPAVDQGSGPATHQANASFQVDDTSYSGSPPTYKLIMTTVELNDLTAIFNNDTGSDAEENVTFISIDSGGVDLRYVCGTRNRGHGSRVNPPHNYRVNFPSDTPWKGVTGFNINARTVAAQVFGCTLAQKAGAAGNNSRLIQLKVNNGAGTGGTPNPPYYAGNEDISADWADRQFPNNGGGNIYSVIRDLPPSPYPNFNYRGEVVSEYRRTYVKQSNLSEDDWRDIMGMLQVMGENQTNSFTLATAQQVANVDQWLTHLAVMNLFGNNESGVNTGNNDDYYWYRGVNDPRFIFVYHDLDTIVGLGGSFSESDTDIFRSTHDPISGDSEGIWRAMNFFLHHPQIQPLYYRKMQDLLDGPFSQAQFNGVVDQVFADYSAFASTASGIKSWMATRRVTVQGVINGFVPPATNNPVATLSGEPRSPNWRTTASLTVGGTNITHYQWRLNNGAWSAETSVATPISLSGLANGSTNIVQVIGKNTGGIYQDAATPTVSKSWVVNTALPTVRLNEVMARNDSAVSHSGTYPDIIELYNEGASPVTLTGMRLTDDPANPGKYIIPATTTLAAGAYLILYADNLVNPGLHTSFTLGANGDALYLYNTVASGGALLDSVAFGPQAPNLSIGRFGTTGEWLLSQPTFGAANVAQALGNPRALKINEWLAASTSPTTEDFIELYNPNSSPVAIGGFYLSDEPLGAPGQHRIADFSFIAAGGYAVFSADGNSGAGADHLNFRLASEQGQIGLFDSSLAVMDCVTYGPQLPEVSSGRCPNGASTVSAQSFPTPGAPNLCPTPAPPAQTVTLLPVNQTWTYNTNGVLPASDWMAPGYNDSGWNGSGPAMLGRVANSVPESVSTPLAQNNNTYTYYFRTHFNVPANATYTSLVLSNLIDDGGVFYINGVEVGRIRLPAAPTPIGPTTAASSITATSWSLSESGTLSLTNIHPGDNVMAVEVHQSNPTSLDNIMAMRLNALIVTNSATAAGVVINEVLANNATIAKVNGHTPDIVEFYNPSSNAVDLAGMSLNDAIDNNPPKYIFPPGSIVPARGYLAIYADSSLPVSPTNAGFGLNAKGGTLSLFKPAPNTNDVLDRVDYGLQTADFSIGRVPSGSANWVLTLPTFGYTNTPATLGNPSLLRINEWMADPASGDDWFELYNPDTLPVALSYLRLTDVFGNPNSYRIPALSFIGLGSNSFQRFEADNPSTPLGPEHVNFKLKKAADSIFLLTSNNAVVIDAVSWNYPQETGVSEGRLPDGSATIARFPSTATPGDANYLPLTSLVVSEILTHTDPPLEDAIELHNLTASPLPVGGWYLSDDKDVLRKFRIPDGTIIPANGYAVFYEVAFNNDTNGVSFALSSADGDQVHVSEGSNGYLTGMRAVAKFGPAANGVSFGRYVNSVGQVDYPAMSARSFGQDSPLSIDQFRMGTGAPNPYPKVGPVILSEIMYHPPDTIVPGVSTNDNVIEEFVELRNTSASPVPLYDPASPTNGWRLRDAVDFTFTSSHSIPPGGHVLVVSFDPQANAPALAQFQARYGSNSILLGPYSGKLDNGSDSVELVKPDPPQADGSVPYVLVEKVVYQDSGDWPVEADGLGMSLQRVSDTGYANEPTNWIASVPTPGPAGALDSDGDGMPDDWELANGLNKNNPADAAQDADADGLTNLQEYLAGTDPHNAASTLRLSATRNGAAVDLGFMAVAGRTYTILYAVTLPAVPAAGSWTRWMDIPAQGVTGAVIVQDGSVAGGTQRFYRIVTPAMP